MKRIIVTIVALTASCFASSANEANQKLLALSEPERHTALADDVRRSGEDCDAVVRSMPITDESGRAVVWSVGCRNQRTYAVSIFADSALRPFVVSCEDLKDFAKMMGIMDRRLNQPQRSQVAECWKKF
jgi:hypothetical protein